MIIQFNIDEIFEMAEQIERNGATFYHRAENLMPENCKTRQLFLSLVDMEVKHEQIFASMRRDILKQKGMDSITDSDPEGLAGMYLRAMADGHVFDLAKAPDEYFTGKETLEDILKMAIEREKNSIIFYLGIKEAVFKDLGQDRVDSIIKEEMSHIAYLSQEIAKL